MEVVAVAVAVAVAVVASENGSNSIIEYKHHLFTVSKISRWDETRINTILKE